MVVIRQTHGLAWTPMLFCSLSSGLREDAPFVLAEQSHVAGTSLGILEGFPKAPWASAFSGVIFLISFFFFFAFSIHLFISQMLVEILLFPKGCDKCHM